MKRVLCDSVINNQQSSSNVIMTCKISPQSDYIAAGDNRGRLNIYKIDGERKMTLVTRMKAHEMHHDWMKKREIEPSIGCIAWMNRCDNHNKIITTNGVSVKLWKLKYLSFKESHKTSPCLSKLPSQNYQWSQLIQLPKLHLHMIDSLSVSSNEEYMLSSDGCSLMKWNFQKPNKPYIMNIPESDTILDFSKAEDQTQDQKIARQQQAALWQSIKPATVAKFCHQSDNRFIYASKFGDINYVDMRSTNSTTKSCLRLKEKKKANPKNIQYYISVMSDVDFPLDQNLIVSRDYLYTYIWDIRKPQTPTFKTAVFSSINNQICELYQQSKIFDRSQVIVNLDASHIITNHYQDSFHDIFVNEKRNFRYKHLGKTHDVSQIKSIDKNYPALCETDVLNYIDYNKSSGLLVGCTRNTICLYDQRKLNDQESS